MINRAVFFAALFLCLTCPAFAGGSESGQHVRLERVEYLEQNYLNLLGFFDDLTRCKDATCRTEVMRKYSSSIDWADANIGGLNALRELKLQAVRLELAKLPLKATGYDAKRRKALLKALKVLEAEPVID